MNTEIGSDMGPDMVQAPKAGNNKIIMAVVITAVVVGAAIYVIAKSLTPTVIVTPTPISSATPTANASSADTTGWLDYTNPTYGISLKYPQFYKYIRKTATFYVQNSPIDSAFSDSLEFRVLLRSLNGMESSYLLNGPSTDATYRYDMSKNAWVIVQSQAEPDFQAEKMAPKVYHTQTGFTAWISEVSDSTMNTQGGSQWRTAYIEDPDNKFVLEITITTSTWGVTPIATKQTIYQILDMLTINPDTTGWKTYKNDQYGFEFKYPQNLDFVEYNEKTPSSQRGSLGGAYAFVKCIEFCPGFSVNVFEKGSANSIDDVVVKSTTAKYKKITVQNYPAAYVDTGFVTGGIERGIYILKDNLVFYIWVAPYDNPSYAEITASFKFTK